MKKIRLYIYIILLSLLGINAYTQETLIEEYPTIPYQASKWGPNRTHHLQIALSLGHFLSPISTYSNACNFLNRNDLIAIQYKLKVLPIIGIVAETGYVGELFRMDKNLPSPIDGLSHNREIIRTHNAQFSLAIRINPDIRRGNITGKYFQFGLFGSYLLGSNHITENSGNLVNDSFKTNKTIKKGLAYINQIQYGWILSVGVNELEFFYKRFLTQRINQEYLDISLPQQAIGIKYLFLN